MRHETLKGKSIATRLMMTTAASTLSIKSKWGLETNLSSGLCSKHHRDMPVPAKAQNAFLNTRTPRRAGCQEPGGNGRAIVQPHSDGILALWVDWLWKFSSGSHKNKWTSSFPSPGVIDWLIHSFILHASDIYRLPTLYSKAFILLVIKASEIVYVGLTVDCKLRILFFMYFRQNPLRYFNLSQITSYGWVQKIVNFILFFWEFTMYRTPF